MKNFEIGIDHPAEGIGREGVECDRPICAGTCDDKINRTQLLLDPRKPFVTSGIRIGSPAMTTCGFTEIEAEQVAHLVADVLEAPNDEAVLVWVRKDVAALCAKFPVYGA